jgi:hypothetical protein
MPACLLYENRICYTFHSHDNAGPYLGPTEAALLAGLFIPMTTLAHLLDPAFAGLAALSPSTLLGAQAATAQSLIDLDDNSDVLTDVDRKSAQAAFAATTNPYATAQDQRVAIMGLRVPQAVQHLAGMLTQYDWAFVEQAKEIRGYVVAKLLEETKSGDARIRLRALELTGKLTEVGSFTERISITKTDDNAAELESRIRARLAKMLPPQHPADDAIVISAPAPFEIPAA